MTTPAGATVPIAVVGENVVDLVPLPDAPGDYRAILGGGPANTAIAAARLGTPTALVARIGADAFGRRVRERLAADGVSARYLVDAREPSSLAVVSFDDERRASYDFWFTGTADGLWTGDELPDPLDADVRALHVGSVALHLEPGGAALLHMILREHARGAVTLTLDPNVRAGICGDIAAVRTRLETIVPLCDVVKASEDDLALLYPDVAPIEVARTWRETGPALIVVTEGRDGATALTEHQTVAVGTPPAEVTDTVGAGDAFMGALLHTLNTENLLGGARVGALRTLSADDVESLLDHATAAATYTCTQEGANPPTPHQLATWQKTTPTTT
ncbi:carbohydrate kinase [Yinghuangia sp. ASG 101]|uniref:carbohydrate kinase family protein n=1 Tax=Yinghuangia sp. ASG 101 TaxID=2896848 RepID=UPI001E38ACFD|nr:carbohydrate kinase [Yinghuangia sp. ASG 101]UGQ09581.1 carbohydrate kinase [Yinghuangia sp. ASG 101]